MDLIETYHQRRFTTNRNHSRTLTCIIQANPLQCFEDINSQALSWSLTLYNSHIFAVILMEIFRE